MLVLGLVWNACANRYWCGDWADWRLLHATAALADTSTIIVIFLWENKIDNCRSYFYSTRQFKETFKTRDWSIESVQVDLVQEKNHSHINIETFFLKKTILKLNKVMNWRKHFASSMQTFFFSKECSYLVLVVRVALLDIPAEENRLC